jgi:hypothetical protein
MELKIAIRMIEEKVDRVRIKMNFDFNIIHNLKVNFKAHIGGDLFIFLTFLFILIILHHFILILINYLS